VHFVHILLVLIADILVAICHLAVQSCTYLNPFVVETSFSQLFYPFNEMKFEKFTVVENVI
jgi:hypothetical protein